jgi:hypothetical protein
VVSTAALVRIGGCDGSVDRHRAVSNPGLSGPACCGLGKRVPGLFAYIVRVCHFGPQERVLLFAALEPEEYQQQCAAGADSACQIIILRDETKFYPVFTIQNGESTNGDGILMLSFVGLLVRLPVLPVEAKLRELSKSQSGLSLHCCYRIDRSRLLRFQQSQSPNKLLTRTLWAMELQR